MRNSIGTLMTDQYRGLSLDEFRAYCARSSIRHVFVAVDSASSNGLDERLNQTVAPAGVGYAATMTNVETTLVGRVASTLAENISRTMSYKQVQRHLPIAYIVFGRE